MDHRGWDRDRPITGGQWARQPGATMSHECLPEIGALRSASCWRQCWEPSGAQTRQVQHTKSTAILAPTAGIEPHYPPATEGKPCAIPWCHVMAALCVATVHATKLSTKHRTGGWHRWAQRAHTNLAQLVPYQSPRGYNTAFGKKPCVPRRVFRIGSAHRAQYGHGFLAGSVARFICMMRDLMSPQ